MVTDSRPDAHSVSLSAWIGAGSRDEPAELSGACHFLEHLLFKGTTRRTAHQINTAVDAVGGDFNAFTAQESTAFVVRVPAADVDLGSELLCEVLAEPALGEAEIEAERGVILEELAMVADSPDEWAMSRLAEAVFPDHGLGWEVLGRVETLEAMSRTEIEAIHRRWYGGQNLVVAAVGRLDHDQLVDVVDRFLPADGAERPTRVAPVATPVPLVVEHRDTEQVHLTRAWLGLDHDDPDRYALAVLGHALGDGPSSRLYEQIRDERGLAYSVFTSHMNFSDSGMMTLYCGTTPKHLTEVRSLVDAQLEAVQADGITDEEMRVAVGYLTGSTILALEDPGTRMARLGSGEITRGSAIPLDEVLAGYRSVTNDDVARVARRVFGGPSSVVAVGPVKERSLQ